MCKNCDILLNVPKDKKSTRVLNESDSYGTIVDRTIMQLNHEENGTPYAFITHQIVLDDNRSYSHPIYIKYCPFCGQRLYYLEK